MASLFFLLFNCCKSSPSSTTKRPQTEPTTISGIPEDPVIIQIITTEPEKDGSLTDESYLSKFDNAGFETEDEEETDSETEEQDYQQFHSTTNLKSIGESVKKDENVDTVAPESVPPSTSESICYKSDYDKLFYSNATAQILMDLENKEQLTIDYLQEKHSKLMEKLEGNTAEKLLVHASLIEIVEELQIEKQIPLMEHAKFFKSNADLVICSPNGIAKPCRIIKKKTKVQIIPYDGSLKQMLCTVLDYNTTTKSLILRQRDSSLTEQQILNDDFEVIICPNSRQLGFAVAGIDAICENEAMLRKVSAIVDGHQLCDFAFPTLLALGPTENRIQFLIENILEITSYNLKVLVCAPTNSSVDAFAVTLLSTISKLLPKIKVPSIRRIIPLIQDVDLRLKEITVQLHNEKDLFSFDIVFCTLGCAPKLSEIPLPKGHFSHIFIEDAQQASELDTWMTIGNLAAEETQLILAGDLQHGKGIFTKAELLKNNQIGYCISMFERLHSIFPPNRLTMIP